MSDFPIELESYCEAMRDAVRPDEAFGLTRIQRICRISYSHAHHVAQYGLENRLFKRDPMIPYRFFIVPREAA